MDRIKDMSKHQLSMLTSKILSSIDYTLTQEEVRIVYETRSAYWKHSGKFTDSHAVLAKGKHSNVYFNSALVLEWAPLASMLASQLYPKVVVNNENDRVVGPSYGAPFWVSAIANFFHCLQGFTEKGDNDILPQMWKRWEVRPGSRVLLAEDVITSGGSVLDSKKGLIAGNQHPVDFYPQIVCLVNRSGLRELDGMEIVSLLEVEDAATWSPEECPLCKQGSKPISNVKQNWLKLTASH